MTAIDDLFGKPKAIIAMAHFPAMPGQPLYDQSRGVRGLRDAVARDVEILAASGVDAVMFCNEGDRPYRTVAGPEVTAVMASVIAELKGELPIPFGVDVLWDPVAAIGLAHAVGASFVREVFSGAYAGDFGVWDTDPAAALSYRRRLGADDIKLFFNVTAEFAAPIAPRDIGLTARSVVMSSLADAVCVSGVVTGTGVDVGQLRSRQGRRRRRGRGHRQYRGAPGDDRRHARDRRCVHRRHGAQARRQHMERGRRGTGRAPRRRGGDRRAVGAGARSGSQDNEEVQECAG